jgi:peroxiredoxin
MNKPLALLLASTLALSTTDSFAQVVRPSPPFALDNGKTIQSLRGQPVILLIARSPKSRAFRKQVKRFEEEYQSFAARGAVFVAAFTESSEGLRSNIPFAVARDGAAVAAGYNVPGSFALAVIGKDGNLDLITEEVSGTYKAMDAIKNNASLQAAERRS